MSKFLNRIRNDKRGVTAMEYGLIAALVAVVIIGGVTAVGTNLKSTFQTISTGLSTSSSGSTGTGTGTGTNPS